MGRAANDIRAEYYFGALNYIRAVIYLQGEKLLQERKSHEGG